MPNVTLPAGVPVDLYSSTGIVSGTQLRVSELTNGAVRLSTSSPGLQNDYIVLSMFKQAENDAGDSGAWALSLSGAGLNVEVV